MSENVKLLKMNCILNDCEDIRVERLAVSNTNGNIKMYTCPGNSGGDSIEYMSKGSVCVNVPCTTLDEYFITHNIAMDSVALIWIDIEGHDAYAINGMKKI